MDTQLIAKILATKQDGKRTIGTGYPVAKDLVLTARHVVIFGERDKAKPVVVEWPDIKNEYGKTFCSDAESELVFDGGEECDIALLRCEIPPQAQISPLLLAQCFPIAHEKWQGFGYPQIGKDEDTATREKISVLGIFHPPDQASHKISLTCESDALKKTGWRGISGAPVFQQTTLYAVITETPKTRKDCFGAVSIPHLLKYDQKFREAVGIEKLETYFPKVITYLQSVAGSQKALFATVSKTGHKVADDPGSIISCLAKLTIPDLLRVIQETQSVNNAVIQRELAQLVRMLLPSLYGFDCVASIRSSKGDVSASIVEIPYATDISAEVLMANADRRHVDFKVITLDYGKQVRPGKYRLSLPPESGPDAGNQQMQDVDDDLYNRISRGDDLSGLHIAIDEHLFKINPRKQQRSYNRPDKKKLVRSWLESEAKEQKPGLYWLLRMGDDEIEKSRFQKLAQDLKKDYPHITILNLECNIDREIEELGVFNRLANTQTPD